MAVDRVDPDRSILAVPNCLKTLSAKRANHCNIPPYPYGALAHTRSSVRLAKSADGLLIFKYSAPRLLPTLKLYPLSVSDADDFAKEYITLLPGALVSCKACLVAGLGSVALTVCGGVPSVTGHR